MTSDVNQFLASAGATSAKFARIGDTVKGVILDAKLRDQTDPKTGKVKYYDDGNPMKQVVITLQTDEQDDEEDDGRRSVYAKGNMLAAVRKAVGRDGIEIGGKLAVKYVGDGEVKQRGFNPPKLYKVWYEAPPRTVNVGGDDADPFGEDGYIDSLVPDDQPF